MFLAFTFSQGGMAVHWSRRRDANWRAGLALNLVGAVLSAVVFAIAAVTKFSQGSWVALLLIGLLVLLAWGIRVHYDAVHRELALHPPGSGSPRRPVMPARPSVPAAPGPVEDEESPDEVKHLVVVPIVRLDLASLRALAYAASLGQPVLAVHLSPSDDEATRFRGYWTAWGNHLPLEVVGSPYRAVVAPLARYRRAAISARRSDRHGRAARADRQTSLASAAPQRHRPATAPPPGRRHHYGRPPPGVLITGC